MNKSDFWINSIKVYFDILYKLNMQYIKLIGTERIDFKNEFIYGEIVDSISKIIPISANEEKKKVSIRKKNEHDGILDLLGNNYDFVKKSLDKIVDNNNQALYNLKMLRNRIEHNPHRLMGSSGISTNGVFDINFGYLSKNKEYPINNYSDIELDNFRCNSKDIVAIIIELNILFTDIQKELLKELEKYDENYRKNDYFKECLDINYLEFNNLYKLNSFNSICKLINREIMK